MIGIALGVLMSSSYLLTPLPHGARAVGESPGPGALLDPEFAPTILSSPAAAAGGNFGWSVAASGPNVVVGAPGEGGTGGAVYLENTTTGSVVSLAHPDDAGEFGAAVAIGSGRIVVGEPETLFGEGWVRVYSSANDSLTATYESPNARYDGRFGASVATSSAWIVVGAPFENATRTYAAGHVYVINAATGEMRMLSSPNPSDSGGFGSSVAVSGNLIVVGAPFETPAGTLDTGGGDAYLYSATTGDLLTTFTIASPGVDNYFGTAVAIDGATSRVFVGAPGSYNGAGEVYGYSLLNTSTEAIGSPNAIENGNFGSALSVGNGVLVVGAPNETSGGDDEAGNAYLFSEGSGTLISSEFAPPDWPAHGQFGHAVAEDGTSVIAGAPEENASTELGAGHAFVYAQVPLTIASPNAIDDGQFGYATAVDGTAIIGAFFETAAGHFAAGHAYLAPTHAGPLITLTSPNAQYEGFFGYSVGIWGNVAAVGAPLENLSASLVQAGRVYQYNASTGALVRTLTSPDPQGTGRFGYSVAVGAGLIVVGAYVEQGDGRAYVFYASNGTLASTLIDPVYASGANFGWSVGISGGVAVVGAPNQGAGMAFTFNATKGTLLTSLTSPDALASSYFGFSVGIGGSTVIVGAPRTEESGDTLAGNAYVFAQSSGALLQNLTSLNPITDGEFGYAVADNGGTVVVGAPGETAFGAANAGSVYLAHAGSGGITDRYNSPLLPVSGSVMFGVSVAVGPGGVILVGEPNDLFDTGATYLLFL